MSLKTSNLPFKARVDHEVHNTIMRKAVVKAQETIGANRQKMGDELGHWEEWRDLSKQIRNHVLANLDAYLYQLSEKVMENGGKVYFAETAEEASAYIRKVALEKNAKKNKIKTPKQVRQLVKFTNDIITRMDEGQNKLNGVERDMTKEESKAYDAYLDIKIGARSALHSFEKRLELYERLWEMPSVSIGTKIECLNETIKLIRKQCGKNLEPRCPHESLIRKHLKAISGYMNRLEEEGEAIWQLRMADELLPTANAWREDCELPALSREEFALQVELQSVHIETKEKEDGSIHYELELFFQDTEDTFAGHFLYADIEDHEVKEITLMG